MPQRLGNLSKSITSIRQSVKKGDIVVVTNRSVIRIRLFFLYKQPWMFFNVKIYRPKILGHPYLLTWSHLDIFRKLHSSKKYSHFLYSEDDIIFSPENFEYWIESRKILASKNLIPSFVRYELSLLHNSKVSVDQWAPTKISESSAVHFESCSFINLDNPYQGCYLMDRDLLMEHLGSESSNPDSGIWNIRERAAQGLTFQNVPEGFRSRNLVMFDPVSSKLDDRSYIYHVTNNYSSDPSNLFGTVSLDALLE
jgi:hypothetical protein